MAPPRRPAGSDVGEEIEVREPDRVAAAPSLRPQVEPDRERDEEEAEKHLGREEVHAGRPVRSGFRVKPRASAGSHGPSVESRRWRTPRRAKAEASEVRSALAASSKAVRTRR